MEKVKIKRVDVENLKAISNFTAIFDGKSAHVTGANGIGKSTLIRAITDRLRGQKPSIITKIGESEGKTVLHLTDGCRFEWEYNEKGQDKLSYFTPDSFKPVKRDVFKHICGQYFPNQFDINKFLTTTEPQKRLKMISELVNVDLTEIQLRYKTAFDIRRDAKRELKVLESQIRPKPEQKVFESSDIEQFQKNVENIKLEINNQEDLIKSTRLELNTQYLENKKANEAKEQEHREAYKKELDEWLESEEKRENEINSFNAEQERISNYNIDQKEILDRVKELLSSSIFNDCFDYIGASNKLNGLDKPEFKKTFVPTEKPEYTPLELADPMPDSSELDALNLILDELKEKLSQAEKELSDKKEELSEITTAKQVYELQMKHWLEFDKQVKEKYDYVQDCEIEVQTILNEIKDIISKTKLPEEFQIDLTDKNDILFRVDENSEYLPITVETLASSAIFIAAFKLQANYLEAFRVAHFDVSYLDYENRQKVLDEAIKMDIQLITESPALDADKKELQYEITEA